MASPSRVTCAPPYRLIRLHLTMKRTLCGLMLCLAVDKDADSQRITIPLKWKVQAETYEGRVRKMERGLEYLTLGVPRHQPLTI